MRSRLVPIADGGARTPHGGNGKYKEVGARADQRGHRVASGTPVPQPAIKTGARMAFMTTVSILNTIVGRTMLLPRSAELSTVIGNTNAYPGGNQKKCGTGVDHRRVRGN